MNVDQIRQLEPKLAQFLNHFHDCFGRKDTRAHLGVYVRGQLSDLNQKSVEPIALEADVADELIQRPTWVIAWELHERAVGDGVHFDWLTFDEGYGSKPECLRELSTRRQRYVAEVPRSLTGWLERPRVVTRPYHKN